jgi:hypothetical protein
MAKEPGFWTHYYGQEAPEDMSQDQSAAPVPADESSPAQTDDDSTPAQTDDDSTPAAATAAAPDNTAMPDDTAPPPEPVPQNAAQWDQDDALWAQDLRNGHIRPETLDDLWGKKDTLGKLGTAFGLLVSGAGSGLAHQPNAVLALMNQEIMNDLEAQKQSKQNAVNYLRLSQNHALQQAQISRMNTETDIMKQKMPYEIEGAKAGVGKTLAETESTKAKTGAVPSEIEKNKAEIAHLKADSELIGTQRAVNLKRLDAFNRLSDSVDKMDNNNPNKPIGQQYLNGVVGPAILQENAQNNAKTEAQIKLRNAIRSKQAGQTAQPSADQSPIDFDRLDKLQKMGQAYPDIPGGIAPGDVGKVKEEAGRVQSNRAMMKTFFDSFDKLDGMFLAGKLNPTARASEVNAAAAKIAKQSAGRYNENEAGSLVEGMFPDPKDWGNARKEKRIKDGEFFLNEEADTPNLDQYHLKRPFAVPAPLTKQQADIGGEALPENVKIQAPSGQVMMVPKASAKKYIDKGGKLVP